ARLLTTTLFVALAAHIVPAHAQTIGPQPGSDMVLLPTGVFISPTAVPGASQQALIPSIPNWPANLAASEAIKSQLSPDGNTLAVITAGYNDTTLTDGSGLIAQFIFIFDVSGANRAAPKLKQTSRRRIRLRGSPGAATRPFMRPVGPTIMSLSTSAR